MLKQLSIIATTLSKPPNLPYLRLTQLLRHPPSSNLLLLNSLRRLKCHSSLRQLKRSHNRFRSLGQLRFRT